MWAEKKQGSTPRVESTSRYRTGSNARRAKDHATTQPSTMHTPVRRVAAKNSSCPILSKKSSMRARGGPASAAGAGAAAPSPPSPSSAAGGAHFSLLRHCNTRGSEDGNSAEEGTRDNTQTHKECPQQSSRGEGRTGRACRRAQGTDSKPYHDAQLNTLLWREGLLRGTPGQRLKHVRLVQRALVTGGTSHGSNVEGDARAL
jgi:hypothetical protein